MSKPLIEIGWNEYWAEHEKSAEETQEPEQLQAMKMILKDCYYRAHLDGVRASRTCLDALQDQSIIQLGRVAAEFKAQAGRLD